jgi:hypothetical protein
LLYSNPFHNEARADGMRKQAVITLILIGAIVASVLAGLASYYFGYQTGYTSGAKDAYNPINLEANAAQFNSSELKTFEIIKNRISIYNTDPAFPGDRNLQWISMRNSTSHDYYQKSMEYLCFWSGQEANGEWQAVVSIYNSPGSLSDYVVEVSRFTWHSLEVRLDGKIKATFPQVTEDTISLGYTTFHVKI